MYRFFVLFFVLGAFISCSKNEGGTSTPPDVIPDVIEGAITEFTLIPADINTPYQGTFLISAVNTNYYKVDFSATTESESNATLKFKSDTILTNQSREFANFGKDAIAYTPVADNQVSILFNDARRINGSFNLYTSFGGIFGALLISQWRDPADPSKPTQKAKNDIINLVERYADKDGPGPGTTPQYLFVKVSKR